MVFDFLGRLPGYVGIGLILAYRYTLSPYLGRQCRHSAPNCASRLNRSAQS